MSGVVTDPNRAHIVGANVNGKSARGERIQAKTGPYGRFIFSDLRPGTYMIEVSQNGFLGTVVEAIRVRANSETVVPPIALKVSPIVSTCFGGIPPIIFDSIEAAKTEIIGGLFPFETVGGIAGATILLTDPETKRAVLTRRSDLEGHFKFSNVRPGTYVLIARFKGYADFIMDFVEVKRGSRTRIGWLEMVPCGNGGKCEPIRGVEHPEAICL